MAIGNCCQCPQVADEGARAETKGEASIMSKTVNPTAYLRQTDREIAAATRNREQWDRYIQGLTAARKAMAESVLEDAARPHRGGSSGTRVELLTEILGNAKAPMSVNDIMAELAKRDHHTNRANVASTLAYLKRVGSAKAPERGQWVSATESQQKAA